MAYWTKWKESNLIPFEASQNASSNHRTTGDGEHRYAFESFGVVVNGKYDVLTNCFRRVEVKTLGDFRKAVKGTHAANVLSRIICTAFQIDIMVNVGMYELSSEMIERSKYIYDSVHGSLTKGLVIGTKKAIGLAEIAKAVQGWQDLDVLWDSVKPSEILFTNADVVAFVDKERGFIEFCKSDVDSIDNYVEFLGFYKGDARFRTKKSMLLL